MCGSPATGSSTTTFLPTVTSPLASGFGIEVSMQVEKRQGYCYEHAFSHNWNALQG
jgi:hypothetical protein